MMSVVDTSFVSTTQQITSTSTTANALQQVPPLTSPYNWCLCRQTNHTKASISTATTPNKAIKTFLYLRKQKSDAIFRRN